MPDPAENGSTVLSLVGDIDIATSTTGAAAAPISLRPTPTCAMWSSTWA
ncbi:MAG TPA: hypothetical protein VFE19_03840 [Jatrophihabitantaceae bacterium]|jgi:hypothetical protein|nr:hypothetical protein [Jatrophihabitantaceae bacterium]